MKTTRRNFLHLTGTAAIGSLVLPQSFCTSPAHISDGNKLKEFGLQLYTLRDDLPRDTNGILKQVASFGYKHIESYEGPTGMFWGMKNTGFKKFMDDLGMSLISSHCDITKDFEKKVDDAAAIGMKYLIYNWPSKQHSLDEYREMAATFNKCGERCKKAGIRFANHNYDSSFYKVDGIYPQDLLMRETDHELVYHQMDIYWVTITGQNPADWFNRYPGRYKLCHIKDRTKGSTKRDDTCNIGKGSIDFPGILASAQKSGMDYFIVEQEHYSNGTPIIAVKENAEYLKKMRLRTEDANG